MPPQPSPSGSSRQRPSRSERKLATREKVEALRREQQSRDRRQRLVIGAVVGVVLVVLAGTVTWAILNSDPGPEAATELPKVSTDGRTSNPPWPLPDDPIAGAEAAGLRVAPMEGTAKHFHAHLDILVNGEPVTVPANIGIHPSGNAMSELHTHDERGVLHIEAPTDDKRYTLGQVFAEWDVRLDQNGIGGLEVDDTNTLRAYVDGKPVDGNPANIELTEHRQIALVYGPEQADVDVPDSFEFAPGE